MSDILLNDILRLEETLNIPNLNNVRVRFLFQDNKKSFFNPIERFRKDTKILIDDMYCHKKNVSFKKGEIIIGLAQIVRTKWLLFHIGIITEVLESKGIKYKDEPKKEYEKYFGRLIINYTNNSQQLARYASKNELMTELKVRTILEDTFEDNLFPGYENVNISWETLNHIKDKPDWKTALENQKGIYLITDTSDGRMYVGAAYGENMLLGRWQAYIHNGHGGNVELKKIDFSHIKQYFRYSILEIFQSKTADETILKRESYWKEVLQTKVFGYNAN